MHDRPALVACKEGDSCEKLLCRAEHLYEGVLGRGFEHDQDSLGAHVEDEEPNALARLDEQHFVGLGDEQAGRCFDVAGVDASL